MIMNKELVQRYYKTYETGREAVRIQLADNLMYLHRAGDAFFKEVGGANGHELLLSQKIVLLETVKSYARLWLTEEEVNEIVKETWEEFNEKYR